MSVALNSYSSFASVSATGDVGNLRKRSYFMRQCNEVGEQLNEYHEDAVGDNFTALAHLACNSKGLATYMRLEDVPTSEDVNSKKMLRFASTLMYQAVLAIMIAVAIFLGGFFSQPCIVITPLMATYGYADPPIFKAMLNTTGFYVWSEFIDRGLLRKPSFFSMDFRISGVSYQLVEWFRTSEGSTATRSLFSQYESFDDSEESRTKRATAVMSKRSFYNMAKAVSTRLNTTTPPCETVRSLTPIYGVNRTKLQYGRKTRVWNAWNTQLMSGLMKSCQSNRWYLLTHYYYISSISWMATVTWPLMTVGPTPVRCQHVTGSMPTTFFNSMKPALKSAVVDKLHEMLQD